MLFAVVPVAFVLTTILPSINSEAVFLVVQVLAMVGPAVIPLVKLGVYQVASENREKFGLWEDGKRIEWFSQESQAKVNSGEVDYTEYFKNQESASSLPEGCQFNPPEKFFD